ncbi:hypothetical protein FF011L_07550 [Roseimaritima multifibrata]|uniref:Inner membrane protein YjjP n=1 Tax=Roseimaritima multifibrata TaxID=1930274 RepID=A0A517MAV5_9BACT|nr:hypothetical protein FF011L_07550 [Roseimaritima multifibrata]
MTAVKNLSIHFASEIRRTGTLESTPQRLVVELSRCLHLGGAPAYELEQRMEQVSQQVGVPAHFFSTPTSLFVTFDDDQDSTRLIRVSPVAVNLAMLAELYALYDDISEGRLGVQDAWDRLQVIKQTNYEYPLVLSVLAYGMASAGVGVIIGGSQTVVLAAGLIGLVIGCLSLFCEWRRFPEHLNNVLGGFVATALASLIQWFYPAATIETTLLAGLIFLVPGLQFTVSINELATQNLASGTARMAGALTTFLTIIFGVVMGYGVAKTFFVNTPVDASPAMGVGWGMLLLVPLAISFRILFRARRRDGIWMLLSICIAYGTVVSADVFLDPPAAAWTAALAVGIASNLFARVKNQPASIMLMPGLLLLVPGSMGFSGVSAIMIHENLSGGVRTVATMLLVAVSIVAGLLVANVIMPTEKQMRGLAGSEPLVDLEGEGGSGG